MISILPVNFISLVTSCLGLQEEGSQTAYPMFTTWAFHIADTILIQDIKPNQSIISHCDMPHMSYEIGMPEADVGPPVTH